MEKINTLEIDIAELVRLSPDYLRDEDFFNGLLDRVLRIQETENRPEAFALARFLKRTLAEQKKSEMFSSTRAAQYQVLIVWLQFLCLDHLGEQELFELFNVQLLSGLALEIEIRRSIHRLFALTLDPLTGGKLQRKLVQAISTNSEVISVTPLSWENGTTTAFTVAAVVQDYNRSMTSKEYRGGLEEYTYLNQSEVMRHIAPAVREQVLRVLQVYDYLRFTPVTEWLTSFFGSRGNVPSENKVRPIASQVSPSALDDASRTQSVALNDGIRLLKDTFSTYRKKRAQVLQAEDALMAKTHGEPEALKRELSRAAREKDPVTSVACLKMLARQGGLGDQVISSPAWLRAVQEHVTQKYRSRFPDHELALAVANLKYQPDSPVLVAEFLQYVLREALGLTENESALTGMEIGQLLGERYRVIAYGNQETGRFEWAPVTIRGQRLEFS